MKKWLKRGAIVVGCVVIVAVIASIFYKTQLTQRWDAEITRLRNSGVPVTIAEFEALYPPVPEEENGALAILRALEGLRPPDIRVEGTPDYLSSRWLYNVSGMGPSLRPEELHDLGEFLSSNAEVIEQLHGISRFTRFRYPVELRDYLGASMEYIRKVRSAAALCAADALYAAEQSDADRITEDLVTALRLAKSLSMEPILYSQFIRVFIIKSTLRALELCLPKAPFTVGQLRRLDVAFLESEVHETWVRAQASEMFAHLNYMEEQSARGMHGGGGDIFSELVFNQLPWIGGSYLWLVKVSGVSLHQKLLYLELAGKSIDIAGQPFSEAVMSAGELDIEVSSAPRLIAAYLPILFSSPSRMSGRRHLSYAHARLGRTALAIKQYYLEHDETLYELSALVPEYLDAVPLDPFDEQPLRMRGFEGGVVVYSIGRNAADDGGIEGEYQADVTIAVWE